MTCLTDTNVVSELARATVHPSVATWVQSLKQMQLSAVTLDEIWFGLTWKPNARVQRWFEAFLADFCIVLPVTTPIAIAAGRLRGKLRAQGLVRSQSDMLIAATAQVHQLPLATRNVADFRGCGIDLVNPFE